jgi:hypothetical protein
MRREGLQIQFSKFSPRKSKKHVAEANCFADRDCRLCQLGRSEIAFLKVTAHKFWKLEYVLYC